VKVPKMRHKRKYEWRKTGDRNGRRTRCSIIFFYFPGL